MERTLSSSTSPSQSDGGSDGNEGVLRISQSSSITGASPSNCLMSYQDTHERSLIPLQRCSQCILQPQLTGATGFKLATTIHCFKDQAITCKIYNPYIIYNQDIGLMSRVFANGPGDQGSIPDRVIPKTQKMVLDDALYNTQNYKVRIKGKVELSREWSSALPNTSML